jgi:predicted GTPase
MTGWLRHLLQERTLEFYLLLALLWLLPALAVGGFGIAYLWQLGWLRWFGLAVLALALLTLAVRWLRPPRTPQAVATEAQIEANSAWSERDLEVWNNAQRQIVAGGILDSPWEAVPDAMLEQVKFVARAYHQRDRDAEYAFTVPELLLMLETWSREYRDYVLAHLPLARQLRVSNLLRLQRGTAIASGLYRRGAPLLTLARALIDPTSALTSEMRARLYSELGDGLGGHLQMNLKRALFEQVTRVAIDLYSGRLKLTEAELAAHREQLPAPEEIVVRPLTILLLGQVNAGKSSLVNALTERYVTEVDPLPATDGCRPIRLHLDEQLDIILVDTPGLDGASATADLLLKEATKADLLLWLCQANQPARALDKQMLDLIRSHFEGEIDRRPPPVLLVTTHNDQLPPAREWSPPYVLEPADEPKARNMLDALDYCRQVLQLEEGAAVVIALPPGDAPFNLDVLQHMLVTLSEDARAVQLNRERLDAAAGGSLVAAGLKSIPGLLKLGSRLALGTTSGTRGGQ